METAKSADGTVIAYERTGDGPPLVVAVGAFCTRRTFVAPPELAANFSVYTYDRRGRGDSGDTQPYAAEREYMEGAPWVKGLEALTPVLVYDLAVCDGGVPADELAAIDVPVLILGGRNSAAWFRRSVADQASATPGARLTMIDGYDHNAPPGVITPIITEFFSQSFPAQ